MVFGKSRPIKKWSHGCQPDLIRESFNLSVKTCLMNSYLRTVATSMVWITCPLSWSSSLKNDWAHSSFTWSFIADSFKSNLSSHITTISIQLLQFNQIQNICSKIYWFIFNLFNCINFNEFVVSNLDHLFKNFSF